MLRFCFLVLLIFSPKLIIADEAPLYQNNGVEIYSNSAFYNGKEIYNADKQSQDFLAKELTDTPDCNSHYQFYYHPLSLVGNYYSYEFGQFGESACGVPGNSLSVQTIDLTASEKIPLTTLFSEESILSALKSDLWIINRGTEANLDFDAIDNFSDFIKQLNTLLIPDAFTTNSFAVVSYSAAKKQAAVRLVGKEYMGFNHQRHIQLGLWLTPTPEFAPLLQNKFHFKLGEFANGLTTH